MGRLGAFDADDVARGAVFFPFIGAVIGAAVAGFAILLARSAHLPLLLAGALAVAAGSLLTRGMHLDALADSVDAFGATDRARALTIMRDPAIGSFGAAAITLDLIVKVVAIAALADRSDMAGALIAAGALSRAAPLLAGAMLPYARASKGSGRIVAGGVSPTWAFTATLVAIAVAGATIRLHAAWLVGAAASVTLLWNFLCRRSFGGVTGDTMGANIELSESLCLVLAVSLR